MTFLLADRVQETSTSPGGTGTLTLAGSAVPGYKTFANGIGTGNTFYYTIYDPVVFNWEVGIGSWTANVLTRTTVLSNSLNTTAFISFTNANTLYVWVDYPASSAVTQVDVGYAPNQIPLNQYLGRLAYEDNVTSLNDVAGIFVGVSDVGYQANQVPLNQYLGTMAYQDDAGVNIGALTAITETVGTLTATNDATISGVTVGKGGGAIATNTVYGYQALAANTTGLANVAVGYQALKANISTFNNTAVGYAALTVCTASQNTGFGAYSLFALVSGTGNTALGSQAGKAITGSENTAVGNSALVLNTSGGSNIAIGSYAAQSNLTSSALTAIGYSALGLTTGANNTGIGYSAGSTLTTGSNNTLIGYQAAPSAVGVSNEVTLGNASVIAFRIPGLSITAGVKYINSGTLTVATLPSASTAGVGARSFVTDALTPTFGATVASGGAVAIPVYSDGTAWRVG